MGLPDGNELHSVRVTGGELRAETDGSTDLARWVPLTRVGALDRSVVIDVGLALHRRAPLTGHVEPIEVTGPLRH
ncbi:hypothetical protein KBX06_23165 [Micromonospora sp. C31]|uniref:hypothetical protein n=1 Tax=Micromonospora sp. C31 TaxID=2824876 RepID=UPI001B386886|nr:hypothetical protein [Micromonospora sp. C31]MBQ1076035.1 hypothetical protein [Micromonospora sp. C31]